MAICVLLLLAVSLPSLLLAKPLDPELALQTPKTLTTAEPSLQDEQSSGQSQEITPVVVSTNDRPKRDLESSIMVREIQRKLNYSYTNYCDKVHSTLPHVQHHRHARTKCKVFAVKHWTGPDILCEASLKQMYLHMKLYHRMLVEMENKLHDVTQVEECTADYVSVLEVCESSDASINCSSTWRPEKLLYCYLTTPRVVNMLDNVVNKLETKLTFVPQLCDQHFFGNHLAGRNMFRHKFLTALYFAVQQLQSMESTIVDILSA